MMLLSDAFLINEEEEYLRRCAKKHSQRCICDLCLARSVVSRLHPRQNGNGDLLHADSHTNFQLRCVMND
jgi:hypothetical protein